MTSYVSLELRRLVESRAHGVCEYCLIHEDDTYFGCQVEHIISETLQLIGRYPTVEALRLINIGVL